MAANTSQSNTSHRNISRALLRLVLDDLAVPRTE
jgi:hypothetical protein